MNMEATIDRNTYPSHPICIVNIIGRRFELNRATRSYIRKRVEERIARFRGTVRSVDVRITDVNGPKGGNDKACSVVATRDSGESLVARSQATTVHGALGKAARILARSIATSLKRKRWKRPKSGG